VTSRSGRLSRLFLASPALLVLLVAPYFGEGLSGATPPLDLVLPWNLAFMVALYGCGALVCREVAHRFGLGFAGLCLLGVAYGVWEEALVDRYWFYPRFWRDSGIGSYSVVWHTNVLIAVHLTAFHTAISICSSVLVVEWLVPRRRDRPWVCRPGLGVVAVALAATPLIYGEFDQRPPIPVLLAATGLAGLAVVAAFLVGRRVASRHATDGRRPRRGLGIIAFGCVLAHWVATYGIAHANLPWPLGVSIAVAPILIGVLLIRRMAATGPYGADGVRTVAGLLSFFVLLDVVVGLGGRYDLTVSGLATAYAIHRLRKRYLSPTDTVTPTRDGHDLTRGLG